MFITFGPDEKLDGTVCGSPFSLLECSNRVLEARGRVRECPEEALERDVLNGSDRQDCFVLSMPMYMKATRLKSTSCNGWQTVASRMLCGVMKRRSLIHPACPAQSGSRLAV